MGTGEKKKTFDDDDHYDDQDGMGKGNVFVSRKKVRESAVKNVSVLDHKCLH